MTLNEIIVSALSQLDRGHDAQTLDIWRDKLTAFANDGVLDLARTVKPVKKETVNIVSGEAELSSLSRECIAVKGLMRGGKALQTGGSAGGRLQTPGAADGEAELTYVYAPSKLSSATDVPELPASCHGLIVTYVVGRERASGDVNVQRGGNVYFQMYEAAKRAIRPNFGADGDVRIYNRW